MQLSLLLGAACVSVASAAVNNNIKLLKPPKILATELTHNGTFFFDQYLDHENKGLGTFKQKIWWDNQYYKGPGSPIVLFTPGEAAAAAYTGYLTNATLTGAIAQSIGGAVVMVEHRYWGDSSPYQELTTKNLQYLTLKNSISDLTHFARSVSLPFDKTNSSQADKAPWVFSGGSYSGALSAWTASTDPGTFWAYHATSAPVEAIYDYWQYFAPIQQGMAKNCSADLSLVIDHIDNVLTTGTKKEQNELKARFGLEGLEHNDDFAAALENGPWLWQSNSFTTGYSGFFKFCDYIEGIYTSNSTNSTGSYPTTPSAEGVGLETALEGYAAWSTKELVPNQCSGYGYWPDAGDLSCFDTYNASSPFFTDISVDNAIDRQWNWFLCNEPFAYWQDGAPKDTPSIVSRLVDGEYWQRQCDLFFPPEGNYTYGSKLGKTTEDVNKYTLGWDLTNTTRLMWVNGEFDPWKTTGVSSEFREGGPLEDRPEAPVEIIPGGFHCSDLRLRNAQANPGVQKSVDRIIDQLTTWVNEYPKAEDKVRARGLEGKVDKEWAHRH